MEKQPYQPISCDFYDELELLALRKTPATILIQTEDGIATINSVIHTFQTKNKEEFMILEDGQSIRLDLLISVNGKELKNYC